MQHTLVAVFDNRVDAQNAMNELLSSGFNSPDVRLSGADSGAAASTDTDTGITGGIKNFFSDLFSDDNKEHATRYQGAVTGGKHVVTLTADSLPEVERAADIVEGFGPIDIDEHASGVGIGGAGALLAGGGASGLQGAQMLSQSASSQHQGASGASLQRDTSATASSATIPVVQEQLKVGKRDVERGGVRIYSRVVETPVHETIGLREEHVDVQRRAVNQPLDPLDTDAFKEQTIEMRERAEEAVVEKSARITEEVTIGKQVSQRQEEINDTVRHTEVNVERLGGAAALDDDNYYRNHFNSTYSATGSTYDEYAPAYSYGSHMAGESRYSGRQWDEIEPELRNDWDARGAGGASTWENMKAAVRHGWNRMTGDTGASGQY